MDAWLSWIKAFDEIERVPMMDSVGSNPTVSVFKRANVTAH